MKWDGCWKRTFARLRAGFVGGQAAADKFLPHHVFRPHPMIQGAAGGGAVRLPKTIGAQFNFTLHAEVFLDGEFACSARCRRSGPAGAGNRMFVMVSLARLTF